MKCDTCRILKESNESKEPACCAWYIDNIVLGDKSVEDCNCYKENTDD